MLWRRRRELKENALVVFKYLMIREAYNIARRTIGIESVISDSPVKSDNRQNSDKVETFDKNLQAVEQYLTDGDWTLARITVDQIILDYQDLFVDRIEKMVMVSNEGVLAPS
jgi:hypothetical protein